MSNVINGLAYGLPVFGIGLVIVFLALVIIICAIWVLSKIVDAAANKAKKEAPAPAPAPAPVPVAEPVVEEEVVDEELIAVIAAAIAAFDQTNAKLVVRSVRRKSGWGKASREEQVYRF
ncbi:MAG: OadG family protein [Clostridia bacterium]|nr:OadG family protein [Clostridia bacterium]